MATDIRRVATGPQEEQKGAGKYAPTLSTEHKMSVKEN